MEICGSSDTIPRDNEFWEQLSEPAQRLLGRLAFLAPTPVPDWLLDVPVPTIPSEDARTALDELVAHSLATRIPRTGTLRVYRVGLAVTTRQGLAEALGWLDAAFPIDPYNIREWPRFNALAPHVENVLAEADRAGIPIPTAGLMQRLGGFFYSRSMYSRAEPYGRRALALVEAPHTVDVLAVAEACPDLAAVLHFADGSSVADALQSRDTAELQTSHRNLCSARAVARHNLAMLLRATDRLDEAAGYSRAALTITFVYRHRYGHAHELEASAIAGYTTVLVDLGRNRREIAAAIEAVRRDAGLP